MNYLAKLFLLFCFSILCFGSLKAQKAFSMVNRDTEKIRTFKYGSKVLFELKNKEVLDSTMKSCLNQETGVYEMRLTKLLGQDLVFNDSILVPYSQIKWMFIQTPSRIVKQLVGLYLLVAIIPAYIEEPGLGLVFSVFLLPPAMILFYSSQKHYYATDIWAIKPAMLAGY